MPAIAATTPHPITSSRSTRAARSVRVTPQIKREFKRWAAIEPVIGLLKEHHRMGLNHLAHASGDAINPVLAAAGYNFRRLLACLRLLLLRILIAFSLPTQLKSSEIGFFTAD
jgi:transposase, IS5 family